MRNANYGRKQKKKKKFQMPKYYVRDGYEQGIIDAPDAEEAVCLCVLHRFRTFIINGFYIVSELGFESHSDDRLYSSDYILDRISDDYWKKFEGRSEKDEEDP